MSVGNRSVFLVAGLFLGTLAGLGWSQPNISFAEKTPAQLLPAETVLFFSSQGNEETGDALRETVAYQSIFDSGLAEVFEKLLDLVGQGDQGANLSIAMDHLAQNGFSVAVAIDPPQPGPLALWGTIVVPYGGEGVDLVAELVGSIDDEKWQVRDTRIQGRDIKYVNIPDAPIDLGWWQEEDHLVIAVGMNAIASTIAVATEKRKNLSESPLYERYANDDDRDFTASEIFWLNFKPLREMSAEVPVPIEGPENTVPLGKIVEIVGLQTLDHISIVCGYRDESLWSEFIIEAPGERTGLLALIDQPTFTIEDLPAIPLNHAGVGVSSFDWGPAYKTIINVVRELAALSPENKSDKIELGLEKFKRDFGFSPEEFFNSLGAINCFYADKGQGVLGLGSVLLVQTSDSKKLAKCVEKIFALVEKEANQRDRNEFRVRKIEGKNDTLFRVHLPKFPLIHPTISVGKDWLIFGLIPQAVQAQKMRINEDLSSWSIETDLADALELLPKKMTSLTIVDPTTGYRELIGLAPSLLGFIELGLREQGHLKPDQSLPIDAGDFPPAEVVTEALFLNVSVSTVDESGLKITSRRSLPTIPLFGAREQQSTVPDSKAESSKLSATLLTP